MTACHGSLAWPQALSEIGMWYVIVTNPVTLYN